MDRLPNEILIRIMRYLQSKVSPCLRVNSRWFHFGICLIWREAFWFHLSYIPKARRGLYSAAIGRLYLSETSKEQLEEFSHLTFPRLKHLNIDAEPSAKTDISVLKRYMHSGLQTIEFGGDFDPELLDHLQEHCHQLQKIAISFPALRLGADKFLNFLRNTPSITEVSLDGSIAESLVDRDFFDHLAGRDNLAGISFGFTIKTRLVEGINSPKPFRSLRKLTITVVEDALPSLVSKLASIHDLHLDLKAKTRARLPSFDSKLLNHLSKLTQLRRLHVHVGGAMAFDKDDLTFLKSLKHLTELWLRGSDSTSLTAAGYRNVDLESLLENLPNLRVLGLEMYKLPLTSTTLAALGQSCPSLERCHLMGSFNMLQLGSYQAPLFLKLQSLCISNFTSLMVDPTGRKAPKPEKLRTPDDHVVQIESHFPKLKDLTVVYTNDGLNEQQFSDSVRDIWEGRQLSKKESFLKSYR